MTGTYQSIVTDWVSSESFNVNLNASELSPFLFFVFLYFIFIFVLLSFFFIFVRLFGFVFCHYNCTFVGQVKSPYHSDQLLERLKLFNIAPWVTDNEYFKQDKVNYAVSEKEHRVTDLTTLTRMTGCTGMFWAATGLYWAAMGCNRLYWAVLSSTGL